MDSYQRLCAMRRRANQQLDQRRYDALHAEANREWEAWLVRQLGNGLPRYDYQGKRVYYVDPPPSAGVTVTDVIGRQGEL